MASEVLNYLLLFSLGLGLVVSMETTWRNLSEDITDDAARVRLKEITQQVKSVILEINNIGRLSSSDISPIVLTKIRLPSDIGGYLYNISISSVNAIDDPSATTFYLSAYLRDKFYIEYGENFVLPADVTISGTFESYYQNHEIQFMANSAINDLLPNNLKGRDLIQLVSS